MQGHSQHFGWGEHQTKFPVRSQDFRFEAVTFSKNLLNKDFKKTFERFILKSNKNLENSH